MSYDIRLVDPVTEQAVEVSPHEEGGTYQLGGCSYAELNITYNYSYFFRKEIDDTDGIRWLYGKTGATCIPVLTEAIQNLGSIKHDDYWVPTPGNAGHALSILLEWATRYPEAIFDGD